MSDKMTGDGGGDHPSKSEPTTPSLPDVPPPQKPVPPPTHHRKIQEPAPKGTNGYLS
jgi:hypothetical protein